MNVSQWNDTAVETEPPTNSPTKFLPTPDYETYYAPSAAQIIMYVVITSIIIIILTILNRCVIISRMDILSYILYLFKDMRFHS